jgi:hypothetical protein
MHAEELVQNFLKSQPAIRATLILAELHPLPTIAPPTINNLCIPAILPRNNMSAPATPAPVNAIIEISPASSPSPAPILGPVPS